MGAAFIVSCFFTLIFWAAYFIYQFIAAFIIFKADNIEKDQLQRLAEEAKPLLDPDLEEKYRKIIDNPIEYFDYIWDTLHAWKEEHKDEIPDMPRRDRILWTHFVDGERKPIGTIPDGKPGKEEFWYYEHGVTYETMYKYFNPKYHEMYNGNKLRVLYLLMSMHGKIPQAIYDNDREMDRRSLKMKKDGIEHLQWHEDDILLTFGIPEVDKLLFDEFARANHEELKKRFEKKYY